MTFRKWKLTNMQELLCRYDKTMFIDSELKGVTYGIEPDKVAIINSSGGVKLKREDAKKMAEEILEILEIY